VAVLCASRRAGDGPFRPFWIPLEGCVGTLLLPGYDSERDLAMVTRQSFTPVPFDNRLERAITTAEDGEVLAVEYRFRSDLQPLHTRRLRPSLVWILLVGFATFLALH